MGSRCALVVASKFQLEVLRRKSARAKHARVCTRGGDPACSGLQGRREARARYPIRHELVEHERPIVRVAETGCGANVTFQRVSIIAH